MNLISELRNALAVKNETVLFALEDAQYVYFKIKRKKISGYVRVEKAGVSKIFNIDFKKDGTFDYVSNGTIEI